MQTAAECKARKWQWRGSWGVKEKHIKRPVYVCIMVHLCVHVASCLCPKCPAVDDMLIHIRTNRDRRALSRDYRPNASLCFQMLLQGYRSCHTRRKLWLPICFCCCFNKTSCIQCHSPKVFALHEDRSWKKNTDSRECPQVAWINNITVLLLLSWWLPYLNKC